jgi:PAS domain S-box-containing protein
VDRRVLGEEFGTPGAGGPGTPGAGGPGTPGASPAREKDPRSRRDPLAWAIVLLGVFVACYSAWWAFGLGDPNLTSRFTDVAAVPGGILVALGALRLRSTRRTDPRTRRAWSIIGLALMGYGVGALVHFGAGSVPFFATIWPLGLGLEFATYLLVGATLVLLPKPARTNFDVALFGLDVAIVAWSASMLLWHFFIFPVARDAGQGLLDAFSAAAFPVADLTLVFVIGAMVLRGLRESTRAALTIAGVALGLVFVGDLVSGRETLQGTYTQGGLSGILYSVAWLTMALAVYAQWRIKDSDRPIRGLADYARSFPWLPYAAVVVAFLAPAIRDWNDIDMFRQHVPATGLLIALVVVRLWVTARQNATLAAVERERLAAAVDQAAEAILTTDRAGHVTYVNLAFSRMTGLPLKAVLGQDPDLLRKLADPAPMEEMSAALIRGDSWAGRLVLTRPDGVAVEIDMAVSPLRDGTGAINGSVAVARDISRERALEAQLAQSQRMEAVGRLAGGIAHDFNNILTAISGFAELAAAGLPADHPVAPDLEQILKASDRAAALTRALLAFSRRQVMQAKLIDINEILGGLTPMLGRLIGEDIQLVVGLDPDLGLSMADRAQLEQVVVNLAVNARDAMPDGGTLAISTANTDVDAAAARTHVGAAEGQYVTLVVRDTGVGMTPAVMEHAFEPFFTTKERGKGTGLGLSTVIGIVQQSGGFMAVTSEPNVGSTFTVHIPRAVGAPHPSDVADFASMTLGGTETILVAEDEDAVRLFVERVLSAAGYRVLTAAHGAAAIATARSLPGLDLLVTDVVMPGMSGVELATQLTSARPGLHVIYASGYSEEAALRDALGDDRGPYLSKPFSAESLLAAVRDALDRDRGSEAEGAPEPTPGSAPEPTPEPADG